jgi:Protein phosphatase 2C
VREASRTVAVPLSLDHRPDRPDELARLSACGARVERVRFGDGSYGAYPRVFGARGDVPGLAVSRCLGCSDARSLGVMATPEVSVRSLSRRDQFLIIASDGLWEALSSAQAVAVVRAVLDSVSDGGAADPATLPPLAPLHSPAGVDADGLPLQGVPLVVAADTTPLAGVAGLAATLATDAPIAPPLAAAFDGRRGTRERGDKGDKGGEGKREGKGRRRRRRTLLPPPPATLEVPDLVERLFADRTRNARNARTRAAARAAAEALVAAATRVYEKRRAPRDDISVTVLLFIHAPDPRGAAAAAGAVA